MGKKDQDYPRQQVTVGKIDQDYRHLRQDMDSLGREHQGLTANFSPERLEGFLQHTQDMLNTILQFKSEHRSNPRFDHDVIQEDEMTVSQWRSHALNAAPQSYRDRFQARRNEVNRDNNNNNNNNDDDGPPTPKQ